MEFWGFETRRGLPGDGFGLFDVAGAQATLRTARSAVRTEEVDVEAAKGALVRAEAALAALGKGAKPKERTAAEGAVASAQTELRRQQGELITKQEDLSVAEDGLTTARAEADEAKVKEAKGGEELKVKDAKEKEQRARIEPFNREAGRVGTRRGEIMGRDAERANYIADRVWAYRDDESGEEFDAAKPEEWLTRNIGKLIEEARDEEEPGFHAELLAIRARLNGFKPLDAELVVVQTDFTGGSVTLDQQVAAMERLEGIHGGIDRMDAHSRAYAETVSSGGGGGGGGGAAGAGDAPPPGRTLAGTYSDGTVAGGIAGGIDAGTRIVDAFGRLGTASAHLGNVANANRMAWTNAMGGNGGQVGVGYGTPWGSGASGSGPGYANVNSVGGWGGYGPGASFGDYSGTGYSIAQQCWENKANAEKMKKLIKWLMAQLCAGDLECLPLAASLQTAKGATTLINVAVLSLRAQQQTDEKLEGFTQELEKMVTSPEYQANPKMFEGQQMLLGTRMQQLSIMKQPFQNLMRQVMDEVQSEREYANAVQRKWEQITQAGSWRA